MKDKDIAWLNCKYVVDGQYTHESNAPVLTMMIKANDNFFGMDPFAIRLKKHSLKNGQIGETNYGSTMRNINHERIGD